MAPGSFDPTNPADTVRWLRVGWLIDGQGGPIFKDRLIGIEGGQIHSIRPVEQGCSDGYLLDLSHCTVLPALIDAHVHLAFHGGAPPASAEHRTPKLIIRRHLELYERYGIAAVRDGGDRDGQVLDYRESDAAIAPTKVHPAVAGWGWHRAGRYGRQIARACPADRPLAQVVASQLDRIDHLKVIQSGINSLDHFGRLTEPQFTFEELQAAVRMAHDAGLPVMAHANGPQAVAAAVEAECDSIEHGYFMGDDNLARLVEKQIAWVPTAVPMAALAESEALSPAQRDVARRTLAHQLDRIVLAHRWGAALACGSDAGSPGVPHGSSLWREMALWVEAGLPLEFVVRCATLNAARLMRLSERGAILPSWRADLIALPCTPTKIFQLQPEVLFGQGSPLC